MKYLIVLFLALQLCSLAELIAPSEVFGAEEKQSTSLSWIPGDFDIPLKLDLKDGKFPITDPTLSEIAKLTKSLDVELTGVLRVGHYTFPIGEKKLELFVKKPIPFTASAKGPVNGATEIPVEPLSGDFTFREFDTIAVSYDIYKYAAIKDVRLEDGYLKFKVNVPDTLRNIANPPKNLPEHTNNFPIRQARCLDGTLSFLKGATIVKGQSILKIDNGKLTTKSFDVDYNIDLLGKFNLSLALADGTIFSDGTNKVVPHWTSITSGLFLKKSGELLTVTSVGRENPARSISIKDLDVITSAGQISADAFYVNLTELTFVSNGKLDYQEINVNADLSSNNINVNLNNSGTKLNATCPKIEGAGLALTLSFGTGVESVLRIALDNSISLRQVAAKFGQSEISKAELNVDKVIYLSSSSKDSSKYSGDVQLALLGGEITSQVGNYNLVAIVGNLIKVNISIDSGQDQAVRLVIASGGSLKNLNVDGPQTAVIPELILGKIRATLSDLSAIKIEQFTLTLKRASWQTSDHADFTNCQISLVEPLLVSFADNAATITSIIRVRVVCDQVNVAFGSISAVLTNLGKGPEPTTVAVNPSAGQVIVGNLYTLAKVEIPDVPTLSGLTVKAKEISSSESSKERSLVLIESKTTIPLSVCNKLLRFYTPSRVDGPAEGSNLGNIYNWLWGYISFDQLTAEGNCRIERIKETISMDVPSKDVITVKFSPHGYLFCHSGGWEKARFWIQYGADDPNNPSHPPKFWTIKLGLPFVQEPFAPKSGLDVNPEIAAPVKTWGYGSNNYWYNRIVNEEVESGFRDGLNNGIPKQITDALPKRLSPVEIANKSSSLSKRTLSMLGTLRLYAFTFKKVDDVNVEVVTTLRMVLP